ncbi:hypothetical protein [Massilia rubra]|uniref:Uncharacterized protein n=1 Tax=Massilia rubra TaxID=2607910 RepID=A0ABX0LDV8_9BURK|nr:hypothetical protein [Massilia rubra]NHZ32382.1 hypothetical protein [Massilia rubra]
MDNHERLQESGGAPDSCRAAEADAMLSVSVPPGLRAIFHVWAQECDPAPMLPRGGDTQALVAAYVRLGAAAGATPVERELLVRVYVNAALNCEFALWTELRHEAATVLRWLAPIVVGDPFLRARVAQVWPSRP